MKKNNKLIIILMAVIILILIVLCILFATDTIVIKGTNNQTTDYSKYIGTWYNEETQNEIKIKNISDNQITFTWNLFRLTSIDDATISFDKGKAIFYYQGYDDRNYDSIFTEDEKFIRKYTIKLLDSSVDVIVEDVDVIEKGYNPFKDIAGFNYASAGTYSHNVKTMVEIPY